MKSFFDYYDVLKTSDDPEFNFVKIPEGKKCRYCLKSYPEVSFNTFPHLVPELFGRNNTASNFECDMCNKRFQKYESDASTMIQHYLSLMNLKTKRGVPSFQSKKDKETLSTTIQQWDTGPIINFGANLTDFRYDYENNKLEIQFRTKRFRPFSVYKLFLKMGISLLPKKDIDANQHYLNFLDAEEPIMNGMQQYSAWRYMLKTKYHLTPKVNLYKAKNTLIENREYPEYTILINFANIIFQFFLPVSSKNISEHESRRELKLELFPAFVLENIQRIKKVELYILDLGEIKKVWITDTVELHYDKLKSDISGRG